MMPLSVLARAAIELPGIIFYLSPCALMIFKILSLSLCSACGLTASLDTCWRHHSVNQLGPGLKWQHLIWHLVFQEQKTPNLQQCNRNLSLSKMRNKTGAVMYTELKTHGLYGEDVLLIHSKLTDRCQMLKWRYGRCQTSVLPSLE